MNDIGRASKRCWPKTSISGVGWLAYFTDPEGSTLGAMQFDPSAK